MDPLRVLLIDDELNILAALTRHLRSAFRTYEVPVVIEHENDPLKARERLRQRSYALVVSDYRMPGLTGTHVLAEAHSTQPQCVRILLSGQVDRDGLADAINMARLDRFLQKPWVDEELIEAVSAGLAQFRRRCAEADVLDEVAQQRGELTPQERELRRLERLEPGITRVERDAQGTVLMDLAS